jgi:hypothetical protein
MVKLLSIVALSSLAYSANVGAFTQPNAFGLKKGLSTITPSHITSSLQMSSFDEDFLQDSPEQTKERIQDLVGESF